MYYVAVTGYRKWKPRYRVVGRLNAERESHPDMMLIHGDYPTKGHRETGESVDAIAKEWAIANGVPYLSFPARWGTLNRAAGPDRNERMVYWLADILRATHMVADGSLKIDHSSYKCLAFVHPLSSGTLDCMRKMKEHGLKYETIRWEAE